MGKLFSILTSLFIALGCMTAQADTFTMIVDDAAKVCVYDRQWQEMTIQSGVGHYDFNEGDFILVCSMTETPLYQVQVNGEVAEMDYNYGGYQVYLEDGMRINVYANYPDIKHTITFQYADDTNGFWTSATIEGVDVTDFNGETLEAKLGTNVVLTADTEKYPDAKVAVDGEERTYFYGDLKLFIEKDYTVSVYKDGAVTPPVEEHPIPFTLYVDNADAILVSNGSTVFDNLQSDAPNQLEVLEDDPYLTITAKEGFEIVKIYENEYSTKTSPVYINSDMTLYVTTTSTQQSEGGTYTLTVDNPSKVLVYSSNDWLEPMKIEQGTHSHSFSEGEYLYIMSTSSDISLYQVLVNGEPVADMYGSYDVVLEDGMNIVINADFPDKDCNITFTYDQGAKGFWKSAKVNDEPVEGFKGLTLTVKAGSSVSLTGDMVSYSNVNVTVNGEQEYYFSGTLDLFVTDDVNVSVSAERAEVVECTLYVDNANAVSITRDGQYDYIENLVSDSPNQIKVPADNPYIYIKSATGYDIVSIKDAQGGNYQSPIRVQDGMEIYITTQETPLDKTAVFFLDHKFDNYFFNCGLNMDGGRKNIDIHEGYNIINFSDTYNELFTNWMSPNVNYLYVNDVRQSGFYGAEDNYLITLSDGDVVKVFINKAPEKVTVSITFNGESDSDISVTKDIITNIDDWNGLTEDVFGETMYTIAGEGVEVSLNETKIESIDNITKVVVTEPYNSLVVTKINTGIENISIEADNKEPVYNLHGVKVGTKAEICNLPAGIYVSNGKKIIIK